MSGESASFLSGQTGMVRERTLSCDLLVAGGGMAGVCCALAAARLGAEPRVATDKGVDAVARGKIQQLR